FALERAFQRIPDGLVVVDHDQSRGVVMAGTCMIRGWNLLRFCQINGPDWLICLKPHGIRDSYDPRERNQRGRVEADLDRVGFR
ncbi:hypothetical protein, partial [Streptococcus pneumoniae]|uniref:hypothetical protein n=1 Tax=Streptococcus pneumoniae TaxID=1313 RepID=UPI00195423DC